MRASTILLGALLACGCEATPGERVSALGADDGGGSCLGGDGLIDCAPYRCNNGACATSCVDDSACSTGNTCLFARCGEHRLAGQTCAAGPQCESGFCTDGVCCQTACAGACQRCDLPSASGKVDGLCRVPGGQDPDRDCPGAGLCTGYCRVDRSCGYPTENQRCDLCKACDGAGACTRLPPSLDDLACVVDCSAFTSECRVFLGLTSMRCSDVGRCVVSSATTCTQFSNVLNGTPCSTGSCLNGACVAGPGNLGDASAAPRGGGCSSVPSLPAPAPWGVGLAAVIVLRRRGREKPGPPNEGGVGAKRLQ